MEEFFQILTNFGFPIALSCYLLLRFEKVLENLTKTVCDLVTKNTALEEAIDKLMKSLSRKKK
jgi:hypothetical protein